MDRQGGGDRHKG
jgi:hypothetical protein